MARSDVRDITSLIDLRRALIHLAERLTAEGQHLRALLQHAEQHFSQDIPAYWLAHLRRAERELNEAKDRLARKQATLRAGESAPATEERKAVQRWQQRLRTCQEKLALSRQTRGEMQQTLDKMRGPVADLVEQAEVVLPTAAARLQSLIDRLEAYQQDGPP